MTALVMVTAVLRAGLEMALQTVRTRRMVVTLHAMIVMVVTVEKLEIPVAQREVMMGVQIIANLDL